MELELRKDSLRRTQLLYVISAAAEESGDCVVPDSMPDIIRIVETALTAEIKSREQRAGRVYVEAAVRGSALYVPETGGGLCRLLINLPISYVFDISEAGGEDRSRKIHVDARLGEFQTRELNPRKISVRASVNFTLEVYTHGELSLYSGIEGGEDFGVEERTKRVSGSILAGVGEKLIAVSDTAELGEVGLAEAEILKYELLPKTIDAKVIHNKIILKGDIAVSGLLSTPADQRPVTPFEVSLPFSGVLECEGATEDSSAEISYLVSGSDLTLAEEGGSGRSVISARLDLLVFAKASNEEALTFLEDAYSTSHALSLKKDTVTVTPVRGRDPLRVSRRELINTGVPVKSIYTCSISTISAETGGENGEARAGVNARLIFEAEDGGVYSIERRLSVEEQVDQAGGLGVSDARVIDESYHISGSEDIEVRFVVEFAFAPARDEKYNQISGVTVGALLVAEGRRPSLTLCYGEPGESFWDLGKRLLASSLDIAEANGLTGEYPPPGKLLLVPRKYR